jgi:hypothetical protein
VTSAILIRHHRHVGAGGVERFDRRDKGLRVNLVIGIEKECVTTRCAFEAWFRAIPAPWLLSRRSMITSGRPRAATHSTELSNDASSTTITSTAAPPTARNDSTTRVTVGHYAWG